MRVFGFLSICIGLYIFSASSGSQHVWMAWSLMGCGFVLYRMGVSRAKKKKVAENELLEAAEKAAELQLIEDEKLEDAKRQRKEEELRQQKIREELEEEKRIEKELEEEERERERERERELKEELEEEERKEKEREAEELRIAEENRLEEVGSYIEDDVDQAITKFENKLQLINDEKIDKTIQQQNRALDEEKRKIELFKELNKKLQKVRDMLNEKFPNKYSIELLESEFNFDIRRNSMVNNYHAKYSIEPFLEKDGYFICKISGYDHFIQPPGFEEYADPDTDFKDLDHEIEFKNENEVVSYVLQMIEKDQK